jgi:hypothetical protein
MLQNAKLIAAVMGRAIEGLILYFAFAKSRDLILDS